MHSPTTRRALLQTGAALGLSLYTGALAAHADPDTPTAPTTPTPSLTEPAIYAFKVAALDAFVIHDGVFAPPVIQPVFAPEGKPEEIKRLLEAAFQPTDHITVSINVLVLKEASGITLLDTGGGSAFGAAMGRLTAGLSRLGIAPGDVKTVVITHAHGDHLGGLVGIDNKPAFPNATVLINKAEHDFWYSASPDLSKLGKATGDPKVVVQTARTFLDTVASQTKTVAPGEKIGAMTVVDAPGHTPGQIALSIGTGADSLLAIADTVHAFALQFPHPEYTMAFDTDPKVAVATRRRIFADAAKSRQKVFAYHLPFPGIGHVREAGKGYEWVPQPWVG